MKKYQVKIAPDECKGCQRCVIACTRNVLAMGKELNIMGFPAAMVQSDDCIGCGICFYTCPEPGAITIYREVADDAQK